MLALVIQPILGWLHCGNRCSAAYAWSSSVIQPILGWLPCGHGYGVNIVQGLIKSSSRSPAGPVAGATASSSG